jgi:hypothetical protein
METVETMDTTEAAALPKTEHVNGAQPHHLEEQLATIIAAARGIAVAAEELLRELSQSGADRTVQHAITMAPRLLAATEQQLASVSAMLRKA